VNNEEIKIKIGPGTWKNWKTKSRIERNRALSGTQNNKQRNKYIETVTRGLQKNKKKNRTVEN